jgi:uncharacterized protein YejL (UPF0352 family)
MERRKTIFPRREGAIVETDELEADLRIADARAALALMIARNLVTALFRAGVSRATIKDLAKDAFSEAEMDDPAMEIALLDLEGEPGGRGETTARMRRHHDTKVRCRARLLEQVRHDRLRRS